MINPQKIVRELADDILKSITSIAHTAKQKLSDRKTGVQPNLSPIAIGNLNDIERKVTQNLKNLINEPAFARIVTVDLNTDENAIYYICRAMQISADKINLASYRAPIGRIASFNVGDEDSIKLPNHEMEFRIVEKAIFTPLKQSSHWDAVKAWAEGTEYKRQSIQSCRALLSKEIAHDEDVYTEITQDTFPREIITKVELRDQPILDKYQDKIFRLPLNSRLFISGAPGTGKTTTLIRRLGQKLDSDFLSDYEKRIINKDAPEDINDHSTSWLMFTSTELLKLYVKEAFNKEGVPAPNTNISTWDDYRNQLARNEFDVLRTAQKPNGLILKWDANTLRDNTESQSIEWFLDFSEWQKNRFLENARGAVADLMNKARQAPEDCRNHCVKLAQIVTDIINDIKPTSAYRVIDELAKESNEFNDTIKEITKNINSKIESAFNYQINRDEFFLKSLRTFIDSISDHSDASENEGPTSRENAKKEFRDSVQEHVRAQAQGRQSNKKTRLIMQWLGDRAPNPQVLDYVGRGLLVSSALGNFLRRSTNLKNYVTGISSHYQDYRLARKQESRWYQVGEFPPDAIHPLEVDIILLAIFELLNEIRTARFISGKFMSRFDFYRNQIVVDEATDFSPVQLKCMHALANPNINSFFACGDLNQRVTNWGVRSMEQMEWSVPGIGIHSVETVYRQSGKLFEFARSLVAKPNYNEPAPEPPKPSDGHGVAPVLAENLSDNFQIAAWLSKRIAEVEKNIGVLPSIAVLVHNESAVEPVAESLKDALQDQNMNVIPCLKGHVLGIENAVRVFSVEHIKGMEFEVVFFVGIDNLDEELFEKYLYIGATRAVNYLGVTCARLPDKIQNLRKMFGANWDTNSGT